MGNVCQSQSCCSACFWASGHLFSQPRKRVRSSLKGLCEINSQFSFLLSKFCLRFQALLLLPHAFGSLQLSSSKPPRRRCPSRHRFPSSSRVSVLNPSGSDSGSPTSLHSSFSLCSLLPIQKSLGYNSISKLQNPNYHALYFGPHTLGPAGTLAFPSRLTHHSDCLHGLSLTSLAFLDRVDLVLGLASVDRGQQGNGPEVSVLVPSRGRIHVPWFMNQSVFLAAAGKANKELTLLKTNLCSLYNSPTSLKCSIVLCRFPL